MDIGVTGVLGSLWLSDAGSRLGIPSSVSESSFREGLSTLTTKQHLMKYLMTRFQQQLMLWQETHPIWIHIGRNTSQTTRPWPLLLPLSTDCLYLPLIFFNFMATTCFLISLALCGKSFPQEFLSVSGYCSLKRSSISPYLLWMDSQSMLSNDFATLYSFVTVKSSCTSSSVQINASLFVFLFVLFCFEALAIVDNFTITFRKLFQLNTCEK